MSASQDGKLIVWDAHTTNKVCVRVREEGREEGRKGGGREKSKGRSLMLHEQLWQPGHSEMFWSLPYSLMIIREFAWPGLCWSPQPPIREGGVLGACTVRISCPQYHTHTKGR